MEKTGQAPLVIISFGRLGDIVACESIYRRLHEANPQRPVWFYCRPAYLDAVRFTPYFDRCTAFSPANFVELKASFPPDSLICVLGSDLVKENPSGICRYFTETSHILNWNEKKAALSYTDLPSRFFLDPDVKSPIPLPEHYVVFCCQSQGKHRQWPNYRWRQLAQYFIDRGVEVVECGISPILNLKSTRYHAVPFGSIQATAKIISQADAAVGIESGLMHIANAFGVFGFVISGRYHRYLEYNHYNGAYRDGKNCNILRFYGLSPFHLPLKPVKMAVDAFLAGQPMTRRQCDLFMLKYLIEQYQKKWYTRLFNAIPELFYQLWMITQFHNRPKLPKKGK